MRGLSFFRRIAPPLFAAFLSSACGSGGPAPSGSDEARPRRVVAIAPNLAEIAADIGAGAQIVGLSSYGRVPPGVRDAQRVGGFIDPSIERIIALRPDLVLGVPLQRASLESCRAAGLRVAEIDCQTLDDALAAYARLGDLLDRADAARRAAARLRQRLDAVRANAATRSHPRTLVLLGHAGEDLQQTFPVTPGTFTHELLVIAGGVNVLDRPMVSIGAEAIITLAPEVIVEVAMDDAGELDERLLPPSPLWARLPSVPAARDHRVYRVESASLLQPGPAMADGAELLFRLIHSLVRDAPGAE